MREGCLEKGLEVGTPSLSYWSEAVNNGMRAIRERSKKRKSPSSKEKGAIVKAYKWLLARIAPPAYGLSFHRWSGCFPEWRMRAPIFKPSPLTINLGWNNLRSLFFLGWIAYSRLWTSTKKDLNSFTFFFEGVPSLIARTFSPSIRIKPSPIQCPLG